MKYFFKISCVTPSKSELQMEEVLEVTHPRGRQWPVELKLTNDHMVVTKVKFISLKVHQE